MELEELFVIRTHYRSDIQSQNNSIYLCSDLELAEHLKNHCECNGSIDEYYDFILEVAECIALAFKKIDKLANNFLKKHVFTEDSEKTVSMFQAMLKDTLQSLNCVEEE